MGFQKTLFWLFQAHETAKGFVESQSDSSRLRSAFIKMVKKANIVQARKEESGI